MKPADVASSPVPSFRVRSPLAVVRDLLIITLCAALIGGFLAQIWKGPAPDPMRAASDPAVATRG